MHYENIPVIYIAGPYRNKDPDRVKSNVMRAFIKGAHVYSFKAMPLVPHLNCGPYDAQATEEFFLAGTLALMAKCDALYIIPGYENSEGTLGEIKEASKLGLPIFYDLSELGKWVKGRQNYINSIRAQWGLDNV